MAYIPSENLWERLRGLAQGFIITKDPKLVLCIKLEPALINSIIMGCLVEICIVKNYFGERKTMLLIEDIPGQPFFVIGELFSQASKDYPELDEVVIDILTSKKLILGLFNLDSMPVYSKEIEPLNANRLTEYKKWKNEPPSNHKNLRFFDASDLFNTNIGNFSDVTKKEDISMKILRPDNIAFEKGKFNFIQTIENETEFGKHGYAQEYSIRNYLIEYFEKDKEYFESPLKDNNEELTDSVIILNKTILLLESKYVISEKKNKKNRAINKAIGQLQKANKYLIDKGEFGGTSILDKKIIQVCITDTKLFNYYSNLTIDKNFDNIMLPLFFTVTSFTQFLASFIIDFKLEFKEPFEEEIINAWNKRIKGKLSVINPV